MEIRFESTLINDVFVAMLGNGIVGSISRDGKRWKAVVYRSNGEDYEATTTQRHAAEAFIAGNVAVPVEEA
jgi:hypothetical protein